ncbi:MAG: N-formylglutamate amidohydrolase [Candidatus Aminicenantes bacterium]|nr:N-formylglutamate amidohydrolase [Candidatus Aminicenantes bacterium]
MKQPVLISIPHGGWKVAEEIKDIWALSPEDAFHDGDPLTSQIYDFSDRVSVQIIMEYYRAVVDLNRQPDDIAPKNPDGVIKSHTCYKVEVYKPNRLPDEDLKSILLEKYYFPYHKQLQNCLKLDDIRMGFDCHSMAAVSPPIDDNVGTPRPLICLGNLGNGQGQVSEPHNRITCDPGILHLMRDEFLRVFQHEDVDIEIPAICTMNIPFEGGYITRQMGNKGFPFIQIEMSRVLYLTEPYFDEDTLRVDEKRIKDLNQKVWQVLKNTVINL